MAFASMHEGIFQCQGCQRTYPEYLNGCLDDHPGSSRKVVLVVEAPMPVVFMAGQLPPEPDDG